MVHVIVAWGPIQAGTDSDGISLPSFCLTCHHPSSLSYFFFYSFILLTSFSLSYSSSHSSFNSLKAIKQSSSIVDASIPWRRANQNALQTKTAVHRIPARQTAMDQLIRSRGGPPTLIPMTAISRNLFQPSLFTGLPLLNQLLRGPLLLLLLLLLLLD